MCTHIQYSSVCPIYEELGYLSIFFLFACVVFFKNIEAIVCPGARCLAKILCLLSYSIKFELVDNIQFL